MALIKKLEISRKAFKSNSRKSFLLKLMFNPNQAVIYFVSSNMVIPVQRELSFAYQRSLFLTIFTINL